jgi:AmmeMemoRadiSam system protein B
MPEASRAPRFAGRLYPADGGRLRAAVEAYIEDAIAPRTSGELVGLIVPHGSLAMSGPIAGYGYKLLLTTPLSWDTVTLVAPSATLGASTLACEAATAYDLPTEPARIDRALAAAVRDGGVPIVDAADDEPVIEMQLLFVQAALGDVAVLPLRAGAGVSASGTSAT